MKGHLNHQNRSELRLHHRPLPRSVRQHPAIQVDYYSNEFPRIGKTLFQRLRRTFSKLMSPTIGPMCQCLLRIVVLMEIFSVLHCCSLTCFPLPHDTGPPLRSLPPQHCSVHSGKGVQPQEPEDDPQAGQADLRPAHVWPQPTQGQGHGAADPQQTGAQGIRLQGRGRVPRVRT